MFIYLIKKIAIPNGVKLHSLAWNPDQGWIACGGESGLLKVLKLDSLSGGGGGGESGKDGKIRGMAAASNLSMNQTLEGHNGGVMCVRWNAAYRKLTTSDQNGLIIVWMLHKGMWLEEMINNRNKSVVRDMKWTSDGSKICIVYEDGAVIVGSVDGNRLWGKELDLSLRFVEWSPDCRHIIFITKDSECLLYDSLGNKVKNLKLPVYDQMSSNEREDTHIIGIDWYDGSEGIVNPLAPTLAIACDSGKVQLSRSADDEKPLILDSKLKLTQCKWNTSGTILALAGSTEGPRDYTVVNFYDVMGTFIKTLKVPGPGVTALSWEGTGLRIALAVESAIYFANIRADYKWACIGKTLIFAYDKPERPDTSVVFLDVKTDTRYTKYVRNVKALRAAGEHVACFLAPAEGVTTVCLCNVIGVILESKEVPFAASHMAMTSTHIIMADERTIYMWQYRTQAAARMGGVGVLEGTSSLIGSGPSSGAAVRKSAGRERMLDVDDQSSTPAQPLDGYQRRDDPTKDPISSITTSDRSMVIGRKSGSIQVYGLPTVSPEETRIVDGIPTLLGLNSNSSRLAVVDSNGILNILDLHDHSSSLHQEGKSGDKSHIPFERKDVWDIKWAEDDADSLAVMEKTRLNVYTFRQDSNPIDDAGRIGGATNSQPPQPQGEPVQCSGYLGYFKNLEVRTYLLDEVLANPSGPDKDLIVADVETKALREARELITNKGPEEGFHYLDNGPPHQRLWQLLAELSLEKLDLATAEKAFVRYGDYQGIQYIKRLRMLNDRMKQRAEVAVYFGRVDEAEAIYREIDRKDLAIHVRERMGDWSRVIQLVQNGGGDDQMLAQAWNKIGDYYADKFKWSKAAQYYSQAKNFEKVAMCFFRMEDYDSLEKLIHLVDYSNRDFLVELGNMLQTVGMVDPAVDCFIKAGDPKQAIDCCVLLNNWNRAVELAEQHNFPQIEGLLTKQVSRYLEQGDQIKAIELYRKANRATDAAQLLANMAEDLGRRQANPLRAKKLQVLAALEVERFRKKVLDSTMQSMAGGRGGANIAQTTAQTLDNLMTVDRESGGGGKSKVLDNAWRGAAAYHYQLLAHRQLYDGTMEAAMKTAIRLAEFEDILCPKEIYSLIAFTAFQARHYGICSRAMIKLETIPGTEEESAGIQTLAVNIFTKNPPYDPAALPQEYIRCLETGTAYHACTVTGRAVQNARTYLCRACRHFAIESELRSYKNCPLCHSPLV